MLFLSVIVVTTVVVVF